jgi:hypothetical protein
VKRRNTFFPSPPTTLRISPGMDPTLFALASTITFPFARSSPHNDPLQQSARKNKPDRIFFSSDTPYLTGPTGRCFEFLCTLVHSVLPGSFHIPPCPNLYNLCNSNQLSILVSAPSKKYPSVFFRSPSWSNSFGDTPTPPNGKNFVSRLLRCTLLVFV